MRGVLPFLHSFYASHRFAMNSGKPWESDAQLEQRQIKLASDWTSMSFISRIYILLNALNDCSPKEVQATYDQCFRRHLLSAIPDGGSAMMTTTLQEANVCSDKEVQSLAVKMGLLTQDLVYTSRALRLLVTQGKADKVLQSDGPSFENAVALHLCRLHDVAGYSSFQYGLRGAWPPAQTSSGGRRALFNTKEHNTDINRLVELLEKNRHVAVVAKQLVPNAQGPDEIVFRKKVTDSGVVVYMDKYQIKNVKESSSSAMAWSLTLGVFRSLFAIDDQVETTCLSELVEADLDALRSTPKHAGLPSGERKLEEAKRAEATRKKLLRDWRSANHSYRGLEKFRLKLKDRLPSDWKVEMGDAVIVWNRRWADVGNNEFTRRLTNWNMVKLWTSDFLEPGSSLWDEEDRGEEDYE